MYQRIMIMGELKMKENITKEKDQDVREKVLSQDNYDKNIFLGAGAGAGKTKIIVDRITEQMLSGYKPGELAAITFTNAAAEELRTRIIMKLKDESEKKPENDRTRKAGELIRIIDRMYIGTIHGFCRKILCEHAYDAEIRPDAKIVQDADEKEIFKRFFDGWYQTNSVELAENLSMFGKDARRLLWSYFYQICRLPSDTTIVADDGIIKLLPEWDRLKAEEDGLKIAAQAAVSKMEKDYENKINNNKSFKDIIKDDYDTYFLKASSMDKKYEDYKKTGDVYCYIEALYRINSQRKALKKTALVVDNSFYDDQIKVLQPAAKSYREFRSSVLAGYAKKAVEEYRATAHAEYMTNDDLLQKAHDLICKDGNSLLAEEIGGKYRNIYVDEFQDTDHIQTEMLLNIAESSRAPKCLLFFVGDPKQSIYRFRGADPEVYYETKDLFEKAGENYLVEELTVNFRSNSKIITWINSNFQGRLKRRNISGNDPESIYTSMNISQKHQILDKEIDEIVGDGQSEQDRILAGVYHMGIPDGSIKIKDAKSKNTKKANAQKANAQKVKTGYTNEEDAEIAAEVISGLINGEYRIADPDAEGKTRRIRYNDILVLTRSMTKMDIYLDAFREKGIPVDLSGSIDPQKDRTFRSFAILYQALAGVRNGSHNKIEDEQDTKDFIRMNIIDKCAWAGAVEFMMTHGYTHDEAESRLAELAKSTYDLDAFALADELLRHPEYYISSDKVIADNGYTQSTSFDIKKFEAMITQILEKTMQDTPNDRQAAAAAIRKCADIGLARMLQPEDSGDSIRFMNEHKAKGLESKIVILADRRRNDIKHDGIRCSEKKSNGDTEYKYYCASKEGDDDSIPDIRAYSDNDVNDTDAADDLTAEADESSRLEYVTATRAEEVLIFMDIIEKTSQFSYEEVDYDYDGCQIKWDKYGREPYDFKSESGVRQLPEAVKKAAASPTAAVSQTSGQAASPTAAASHESGQAPCRPLPVMPELSAAEYLDITPSAFESQNERKKSYGEDVVVESGDENEDSSDENEDSSDENEDSDDRTAPDDAMNVIAGNDQVSPEEKRPVGNIFGTVMHRTYELIMKEWKNFSMAESPSANDISIIKGCVIRAVMESRSDIDETYRKYGGFAVQSKIFADYLFDKMKVFIADEDIRGLVGNASKVMTEYPFSFITTIGELRKDDEVKEALDKKLIKSAGIKNAKDGADGSSDERLKAVYPDDMKAWVHGAADLVIVSDDKKSVTIVDYKSDIKSQSEDPDSFRRNEEKKYAGQLVLYRFAMKRAFGTCDVRLHLYDLYA